MQEISLEEISFTYHPFCPFCREALLLLSEYGLSSYRLIVGETYPFDVFSSKINGKYSWHRRYPIFESGGSGFFVGIGSFRILLSNVFCKSANNLLPSRSIDMMRCYEFLSFFDQEFHYKISLPLIECRYLPYLDVDFKISVSSGKFDDARLRLGVCLADLERLLFASNYLAGDCYSFADFCVASHLSCLDYLGLIDWSLYLELKSWYMRLKSRPSMRPILAMVMPELAPSSHYSDLDF